MSYIRVIGEANPIIVKLSGIYILSHLLNPDDVELYPDYFIVDKDKITLDDCRNKKVEIESKWWKEESCDFDVCSDALDEYCSRILKGIDYNMFYFPIYYKGFNI